MKKVKQKFLKSCNAILMVVLTLLGFSNCDRMGLDMYGTPTPEYGTPYAKFIIKGVVADKKTEQPIEGIQVKVVSTFTNANGEEDTVFLKPKKITDEDGSFKLKKHGIRHLLESDAFSVAIHFSDIDGEKNGLFENKAVGLSIEDFEETKPPSGSWFMGEFTKTLDVKLTPQADEENDETN